MTSTAKLLIILLAMLGAAAYLGVSRPDHDDRLRAGTASTPIASYTAADGRLDRPWTASAGEPKEGPVQSEP